MSVDALLPAAFLAGFLGSSHCVGMCGAVVVLFEGQVESLRGRWQRRLLCNVGRLGFYTALGAVAGAGGALITQVAGLTIGLTLLRLAAGLLVILLGCNLAFGWRALAVLERTGSGLWQKLSPLTRQLLPISSPARALGAGLLWGALPCGLVYSAVSMAATTGGPGSGALVMFLFWLGTLPTLLAAGASAAKVVAWRRNSRLRRLAGIALLVVGLATVVAVLVTAGGGGRHMHSHELADIGWRRSGQWSVSIARCHASRCSQSTVPDMNIQQKGLMQGT